MDTFDRWKVENEKCPPKFLRCEGKINSKVIICVFLDS